MQPPRATIDPSEQTCAVITAWAVAWALSQFMPIAPAIIIGWLAWAFIHGRYRRQWLHPDGRPDPGA